MGLECRIGMVATIQVIAMVVRAFIVGSGTMIEVSTYRATARLILWASVQNELGELRSLTFAAFGAVGIPVVRTLSLVGPGAIVAVTNQASCCCYQTSKDPYTCLWVGLILR